MVLYVIDDLPITREPEVYIYLRRIDELIFKDLVFLHKKLKRDVRCHVSSIEIVKYLKRLGVCDVFSTNVPEPSVNDLVVLIRERGGISFYMVSVSTAVDRIHTPWEVA